MKQLSQKDIKEISLELLDDLHDFCQNNSIKYSLGYGTLIGAIRHKGFIPWDDDIDIMMPRPDFERFCALYKERNGHKLYAPSLKNTFITYGRLCDVKKTSVESPAPWNDDNTGVWIDIFPIDGTYDDEECNKKRFFIAKDMYEKQIMYRFAYKYKKVGGLRNIVIYLKKRIHGCKNVVSFAQYYDLFCKEIKYGETNHLTGISCPSYGKVLFYELEDFDKYICVPFEGKQYMIITGYDSVLRCQYGDYMQLPPESQRTPAHSAHKYYWK